MSSCKDPKKFVPHVFAGPADSELHNVVFDEELCFTEGSSALATVVH